MLRTAGRRSSRPRTTRSKTRTRGWNVNVQYQSWGDHLQKFDATIAANDTPDVIEMGNTEMTKYMAAGAFANISAVQGLVRQLEQLARRPEEVVDVQRQALRSPVLRGLPPRHLPHRPVHEGAHQEGSEEPDAVRVRPREGQVEEPRQGLHAVLHGGNRLVQRAELRLRLRRIDRRSSRTASGTARWPRRSRSRGSRPTRSSSRRRRRSRPRS